MKKSLAVLTSVFLIFATLLSLAACSQQGGSGADNSSAEPPGSSQQQADPQKPATNFPQKTITMVVGNAAGGGSDICARLLAQYLQEEIGWTVVVTNNPTGSGEAAFLEVAASAKDGYTIGFMHAGQILATLLRETKYDLERDVDFVAMQTSEPRCLVVRKDETRFTTFDELAAYAKEHPGELIIADSGLYGNEHFVTEAAAFYGGFEVTPMHTNGSAESKVALLGGHVDAVTCSLAEAYAMILEDEINTLAISSAERRPEIPDVPTFKELGINVEVDVLRGIYIAKDTPEEIVKIISDAIGKVSENEEYIAAMQNLTLIPRYQDYKTYTETVFATRDMYKELMPTIGWEIIG